MPLPRRPLYQNCYTCHRCGRSFRMPGDLLEPCRCPKCAQQTPATHSWNLGAGAEAAVVHSDAAAMLKDAPWPVFH